MAISTKKIEDYVPVVKYNEGIYTELDVTTTANALVGGTLGVTGATTFTVAPTGPTKRATSQSALVGATVVLTEADSGKVLINRSTSGSPSWTLPTAADGLTFTFVVANVTAGFTVTGGN